MENQDQPIPTPVVKIEDESATVSAAIEAAAAPADDAVVSIEDPGTVTVSDEPGLDAAPVLELDSYEVAAPVAQVVETLTTTAMAPMPDLKVETNTQGQVTGITTTDHATIAPVTPEAAPETGAEDDAFAWPAPNELKNATTDVEYFSELTDKDNNLIEPIIPLPADSAARTYNYLNQNPHLREDTEEINLYKASAIAGVGSGSLHDTLLGATQREGAQWRQQLRHGQRALGISQPTYGEEGPLLTGGRAVRHVAALLGVGGEVHVPMYHSGFWITLRAPEELEVLNCFDAINTRKIEMGNETHGLAFSNQAAYAVSPIMDLVMACVIDTSIEGISTGSAPLREMMQAPDLHLAVWGLAAAHNPKGFRFERAIISADGKRQKVVEARINIGRALRVDDQMFNDWQRGHMAKRTSGAMKREQIQMYRDHFSNMQAKLVKLSDKVSVELRVPTIDEYIYSGTAWVDGLIASIASAFTEETSLKERNRMVTERAKATSMRQYAHWVASIEVDQGEGKEPKRMTDLQSIVDTLTRVSAKDNIRNLFYTEVQKYINDVMVALIGIPQVHPGESVAVKPRFDNIIPIDPISVFFNLLYQITEINRMRP